MCIYMYGIHGVVDDTMMLRWWWESYRVLESWRCFSNGWLTWKPVYCNITVQVVTSTSRIEFPSFLPSFSTDPSHWSYVSIHSSGRSMRIDRDKINDTSYVRPLMGKEITEVYACTDLPSSSSSFSFDRAFDCEMVVARTEIGMQEFRNRDWYQGERKREFPVRGSCGYRVFHVTGHGSLR